MTKKELSEQEIAYICECLKTWKTIPIKYKDLIFEEERKKQEYELFYGCKERETDIIADTWATPLQKVKSYWPMKAGQRDNKIIFWDNLQVLKTILTDDIIKKDIEKSWWIKLIYIDPPFATKSDFKSWEWEKAYWDKIAGAEFIEFLRKRLVLMREILTRDGFLIVHLDQKKSHYIKLVLDEIFWEHNFVNEIVWAYRSWWASKTESLPKKHDNLLVYRKTEKAKVNPQIERQYLEKSFMDSKIDEEWRFYSDTLLRDIFQWVLNVVKDKEIIAYNTRPVLNLSSERIWYPTQKPEWLIALLIDIFSNKWDIVLDAFIGSWTTLSVAEKLRRKRIWIDCWKLSLYTAQNRLMNLKSEVSHKWSSLQTKPFSVYNAGLYDYKILQSLDWDWYVDFSLALFQAKKGKHKINWIELDWYIGVDHVQVFNYNHGRKGIGLDYDYIKNLHDIIGKKITKKFYIICPASKVDFIEDVVKYENVEYYILRVPYSIISELHKRPFDKIRQPASEDDINNTVDAVGFDFIQIPKIELDYKKSDYSIHIKTFESKTITKKPLELENLESLSMVIIDYNYNWEYVNFEEVLYADQIKKNGYKISLDKERLKQDCMIIYIDIFWNEKREIISLKSFR